MKINIVAPTREAWILRRIARSFQKHLSDCVVSRRPSDDADINFYVNYGLFSGKTKACDIGFFTHREMEDPVLAKHFDDVAAACDWCVAMCDRTAALLPPEKTTVIHVAPDPIFQKKKNLILGVIGRKYPTRRKRTEWLKELREVPGVKIRFTNGWLPWRMMPWFYRRIDYLLILADNEGGPVPLLEALAMGVPVISSDVGFVPSYTTIRYNDLPDLKRIINGLVIPKNAWQIAAAALEEAFRKALAVRQP
jgi:Glycosyltransferase